MIAASAAMINRMDITTETEAMMSRAPLTAFVNWSTIPPPPEGWPADGPPLGTGVAPVDGVGLKLGDGRTVGLGEGVMLGDGRTVGLGEGFAEGVGEAMAYWILS